MCTLVEISGFYRKKGILVILDSRVFWSFIEEGIFINLELTLFKYFKVNSFFY